MRVSGGLTKRVRFDVFSRCAGTELMTAYSSLTADPQDQLWNISVDSASPHVRFTSVIFLCYISIGVGDGGHVPP